MTDMGYDISDYRAINPAFGTMEDWDNLCAETHKIGMKLVMDLVVNHTSDQHAWFQESMNGGPKGSKRDWYVWKPAHAKTGKEPNNWGAMFGGSCWEKDTSKLTEEYFLHVFDVTQPDLNWENPEVREAVWDVMRFWLDKGCDGFRMDVINCISKEPGFPDVEITHPDSEFQYGLKYRFSGPKVKEYLTEMHEAVLCKYPGPAFTVGECPGVVTPDQGIDLVTAGKPLQVIALYHILPQPLTHSDDLQLRTYGCRRSPGQESLLPSRLAAHSPQECVGSLAVLHASTQRLGQSLRREPRPAAHPATLGVFSPRISRSGREDARYLPRHRPWNPVHIPGAGDRNGEQPALEL